MSKCPNCGVEVEEGAKFCGECGAPVPQVKECPQCHAKWPIRARFCGDCGYNFATGSMSAAGAALIGGGNTIAGDIVNNLYVSNSGNVSNVVTNTGVANVVCNVTNGNVSDGVVATGGVPLPNHGGAKRKYVVRVMGVAEFVGAKKFKKQSDLEYAQLQNLRKLDPDSALGIFYDSDYGMVVNQARMTVSDESGEEVYALDLCDCDGGVTWEEDDSSFYCELDGDEVALYVRQKVKDGFVCDEFETEKFDPSKFKFLWSPFAGARHGGRCDKKLEDILYDGESLGWTFLHESEGIGLEVLEHNAWNEDARGRLFEFDLWSVNSTASVDEFIENYLAARDLSKRPSFGTEIDCEIFPAVLRAAQANSGGWRRTKAQLIIGDCYFADDGKGVVEHNGEKAYKYYQESSYGEFPPAMIMRGICCEQGIGTEKDERQAHQMFARAARGGGKDAAYVITERCKGCTMCIRKCPVQAITGTVKKVHVIDRKLCTNCGACEDVCKFHAVVGELTDKI